MTQPTLTLQQGTTRSIDVTGITDALGDPLDVTGWTVRAVARRAPRSTVVLAEWHSAPTGTQGTATADATGVHLAVPPAMSDTWEWSTAVLHIEITEPVAPFREERIGDVALINDFSTIH